MDQKELEFANKISLIKKLAKEQDNLVSEEQVEAVFASMELDKEKMQMVYDFLKESKVGIGEPVDLDSFLTKEDMSYLDIYLEELQAIRTCTQGEKEAILISAMAGDTDAKIRLIEIFLPQVIEIAKLYAGQKVLLEDLIGEGNVALTMGAEMLGCLEKPAEVEGMLAKMIMDAMEAYITENTDEENADKNILKKVNEVADRARELAEVLGRKVTIMEMVRETGMKEEQIRQAVNFTGGQIEDIERLGY